MKETEFKGRMGEGAEGAEGGDEKSGRKLLGTGPRKKVCRFCADTELSLDYKNTRVMQSFLTEHGRIVPRRISGACAFHQRRITVALKRARQLALVGYTDAVH